MKLKYSFETVEMGEKIIIVPVGEGATQIQGILRLNKEGLEVLNLIKTHTSREQIISTLADKYENDREQLAEYVKDVETILADIGMLEE